MLLGTCPLNLVMHHLSSLWPCALGGDCVFGSWINTDSSEPLLLLLFSWRAICLWEDLGLSPEQWNNWKGFPDTQEKHLSFFHRMISCLCNWILRYNYSCHTCDWDTSRVKSTCVLKVTWRPVMNHFQKTLWETSSTALGIRLWRKRSVLETVFSESCYHAVVFPVTRGYKVEYPLLQLMLGRLGYLPHPIFGRSHGVRFTSCL